MKKLLFTNLLILFALATSSLYGQYGNEWIEDVGYDKTFYKFNVGWDNDGSVYQEGKIIRIPYSALQAAGIPLDAQNFKLFARGEEVPIYVKTTGGSFGSSDYIEFYGKKNDGFLDRELVVEGSWQLTPDYSLFTDTIQYYLTSDPAGDGIRYDDVANNVSNPPAAEPYFIHQTKMIHDNFHYAGKPFQLASVNNTFSDFDKYEGFATTIISKGFFQTKNIPSPAPYNGVGAPPAVLNCKIMGRSNEILHNPDHQIEITANDNIYGSVTLEGYNASEYSFSIDIDEINATNNGKTKIRYKSLGGLVCSNCKDENSVAFSYLSYPRLFDFDNERGFYFELGNTSDKYIEVSNFNGGSNPVLYDMTNLQRYIPVANGTQFQVNLDAVPGNGSSRELFMANTTALPSGLNTGFEEISSLTSINFVDYSQIANQGQYIILYNEILNAASAGYPVDDYETYRASQQGGGYDVIKVDVEEVYDQFGYGVRKHPWGIRKFLDFALETWNMDPEFLLLLGKSVSYNHTRFDPTINEANLVPSYGYHASDMLLSANSLTSYQPRIAKGRVSAKNGAELRAYHDKILEYESVTDNIGCNLEDREWLGNTLQLLSGYNPDSSPQDNVSDQLVEFAESLESWQEHLEGEPLNGQVLDRYEYIKPAFAGQAPGVTPPPSDFTAFQNYINNEGVAVIDFLGHSDANDFTSWDVKNFDFDIDLYSNEGQYPLIFSGSCFVGNIHNNPASLSMAEIWTLEDNKGAIGYLAGVHFGFPGYLSVYVDTLHHLFSNEMYGTEIGKLMVETIDRIYIPNSGDTVLNIYRGIKKTIQEFTWSGDPALTLYKFDNPELYFETECSSNCINSTANDVYITPSTITNQDEITLNVKIRNMGLPVNETLNIRIEREQVGGNIDANHVNTFVAIDNTHTEFTYTFDIDVDPDNWGGADNIFRVYINDNLDITEDCYDNNCACAKINIPQGQCPINITGINNNQVYCSDDFTPVLLNGNATDGTFLLDGLATTNTIFPSSLSVGFHTISYSGSILTDGTVCDAESTDQITIEVVGAPNSSFAANFNEVCIGSGNNGFTFDGSAGPDATYSWNFGIGATPSSGNTAGPFLVEWNTPGTKTVTLTVDDNGCIDTYEYPVSVFSAIEAPVVECIATNQADETIEIQWNDVSNAVLYNVNVDGSTFNTNDNTYTIPDIEPGVPVNISVSAVGPGNCSNSESNLIVCSIEPTDCEPITFSYPGVPATSDQICMNESPIALNAEPAGGTFSGTGVSGNFFNPSSITTSGTYPINYTYIVDDCTYNETLELTLINAPSPAINGNTSFCPGGSVELSAVGAYDSYSWNGTVGDPTLTVTTAGTYTLLVEDENGCTESTSITVSEQAVPEASISSDSPTNTICSGGQVQLSVLTDAGNGVLWNNNQSAQTIIVTEPGNYSAVVTSTNGCENTVSVDVALAEIDPPNITSTNSNTLICEGSEIQLQAEVGYSAYYWYLNGAQLSVPTNQSFITIDESILPGASLSDLAGDYQVLVTNAQGCTGESVGFSLTYQAVNPPLVTGNFTVCGSTTANLDVAGDFDTYSWYNGAGELQGSGSTISLNNAGAYYVLGETNDGCEQTFTFDVAVGAPNPPEVSGNLSICSGQATTLTATGDFDQGFNWYNFETGANLGSGETFEISAPGAYQVVGLNSDNCNGVEQFTIEVGEANDIPSITYSSGNNIFCQGEAITLTAAGDFVDFNWYNDQSVLQGQGTTFTPAAGGNYYLAGVDINGCQGIENFSIVEGGTQTPEILGDVNVCNGEQTVLSATGNFDNFTWNYNGEFFSNDATIIITEAGNYEILVTDNIGCETSNSAIVSFEDALPPIITGATAICAGENTILTATGEFTSYTWFDENNIALGNDASLLVSAIGSYTVVGVNDEGCSGSETIQVVPGSGSTPTISGDSNICQGGSTTISAEAGFSSYTWTNSNNEVVGNEQSLVVSASDTYTVTVQDDNGCGGNASYLINIFNTSIPEVSGNLSVCSGQSTTLSATGNFNTYAWYLNGELQGENADLEVTAVGSYTVFGTDGNSCETSTTVEVGTGTIEEPTLNGVLNICEGQSTNIGVEGTYNSYTWYQADNTLVGVDPTIEFEQGGDYYLVVSDDLGCSGVTNFSISIIGTGSGPAVNGNLNICSGQSTTLSAENGFTNYVWTNANNDVIANSQSVVIETPGDYTVMADGVGGCMATSTITVTAAEVGNPPTVNGNLSFCPGQSTTLSAEDGFTNYVWTNANNDVIANSQSVVVEILGDYTVTADGASGCTVSSTVSVTAADVGNPPTVNGNLSFCSGQSTTLSAEDGFTNYIWTNANNDVIANSQSVVVEILGDYTVTANGAGGCTVSATVTVSDTGAGTPPSIDGNLSICTNQSTVLTAQEGYTDYQWYNSNSDLIGTEQSVTVTALGDYTVIANDPNGCSANSTITVNEAVSVAPSIEGAPSVCPGQSTELTAEDGYTDYTWFDPAGEELASGQSITVSEAGEYTVTANDGNGCAVNASFTLSIEDLTEPDVSGALSICNGQSTDLSADGEYDSYSWNYDGEEIGTEQSISVSELGEYTLIVTIGTCSSSSTVSVEEAAAGNGPAIDGALGFCPQGETTITAADGYENYVWTNADDEEIGTEQSITVTEAGDYTVTATAPGGCDVSSTETINNFDLTEAPAISGNLSACNGELVTIEATGDFDSYDWYNASDELIAEDTNTLEVDLGDYYTIGTDANGCTNASETITVDLADTAIIDLESGGATVDNAISICEGESLTLTASGNYTEFVWTDADGEETTAAELEINAEGEYTITGTVDGELCADSQTITVNIISLSDEPEVNGALSICGDGSTTLEGEAGFDSYEWTDADGEVIGEEAILEVTETGTYNLTVVGEGGCSIGTSVEVDIFELGEAPQVDGTTAVCDGGTTSLEASGSYDSYQWLDTDGEVIGEEATIVIIEAGTYTLVGTDANNCDNATEFVVTISDILDPPTVNGTPDFCPSLSTTLEAEGTFESYEWQDADGEVIGEEASIEIDEAGSYLLVGTDENGCTSTSEFEVNELAVNAPSIEGTTIICEGETTTLSVADDYDLIQWFLDGELVGEGNSIDLDEEGEVEVITTDANSCETSETASVLFDSGASPVAAISTDQTTLCLGETLFLEEDAENAIEYEWTIISEEGEEITSDEQNPSIILDQVGEWNVTLLVRGCGTTQDETSVQSLVTVNPLPVADIDASSYLVCEGEEIIMTVLEGNADSYLWSGGNLENDSGEEVSDFPDVGETTYTFTAELDGCTINEIFSVNVNPLPTVSTIIDSTLCPREPELQLSASGGVDYEWLPAAPLDDPLSDSPNATIAENTTFFVTVTDINGCAKTDSVNVSLDQEVCPEIEEFIPNVITPNNDGFNDTWKIDFLIDHPDNEIKIYNRWGQLVYEATGYLDSWGGTNEGGDLLPNATYYYILQLNNDLGESRTGNITILNKE